MFSFLFPQLHCCGVHNASDWTMYPFSKMAVPTSCCNLTQVYNTTTCNTQIGSKDIYNEVRHQQLVCFFFYFVHLGAKD